MYPGFPHPPSHNNRSADETRQTRTMRQRERRRLMTQQQREAHLSQRRTNYRRQRRGSVPETYANESTMNLFDVTITSHGVNSTDIPQACRVDPIPFYTLPTIFERGSSSTDHTTMQATTSVFSNENGAETV